MAQTDLNEALNQLYRLSQTCLTAVQQENWPAALDAMANRQPCLDVLEAACPLPSALTAQPLFADWKQLEAELQTAMSLLNAKQVELQQVFVQIQSARQQLQGYQLSPDKQPIGFTQSVDG
jgi:hypothetical protein